MLQTSGKISEAATAEVPAGWMLDSHVHVYPEYDPAAFLDAAMENFAAVPGSKGFPGSVLGCLVLLETPRTLAFDEIPTWAGEVEGWQLLPTAEPGSLIAAREGAPAVALVQGRQLRTQEGLEVLVVGTPGSQEDHQPIARSVRAAAEDDVAVIVPWGFGKWTGRRGQLVEELLQTRDGGGWHLGDSGNRPRLLATPRPLAFGRREAVPVLPGSDPLPFAFHTGRAGACGVFLHCEPDLERPLLQVTRLIKQLSGQPPVYRSPEPIWRFVVAQVLLQVARLAGNRAA